MAGLPVRVAPRPVILAGREDLLADLAARLAGGRETGPRVVALCGLGGAGKTSVAVEYAHRQLGQLGLVWQIPAEDPSAMAAGIGQLAAQLGARDLLDTRDPVAAVHAVLAARPGGWLLILDNAEDEESVRPVLPPAGNGQVIMTTRSAHWPVARAVEVPVLDRNVAAGFLTARTGDGNPDAAGGAGRAAAGPGTGRRIHHRRRPRPCRVSGPLPGPAGGPAGPRRPRGVRQAGHHDLVPVL